MLEVVASSLCVESIVSREQIVSGTSSEYSHIRIQERWVLGKSSNNWVLSKSI